MNASITRTAIQRQLAAMGCDAYDIGVLQTGGRMLLREGCSAGWIEHAMRWLRRENVSGAHIFVRPHGEHCLTLIDDLDASAILELKHSGCGPAVVVETSVGNFQAWLKHGRVLSRTLSTQAAKKLARRFGGDPSSADWRHFGRLAGFTNQKPQRRLANGLAPFVKLHEWSGRAYDKTEVFLAEATAELRETAAELEIRWQHSRIRGVGSHPSDSSLFIVIFGMEATFIGPRWAGRSTRPGGGFLMNKFAFSYFRPVSSLRRADAGGSSTMRGGLRRKR